MADTTPRLHTAIPDATTAYLPISWYAVIALTLSVIFIFLAALLSILAYRAGKPLTEPWLFGFPIIVFVLCFVARRQIRDSENTRTGEGYANAAWWLALSGSAGIFIVMGTAEFLIREETSRVFNSWTANLLKVDPTNPNDPSLASAFHPTIPAGSQGTVSASDASSMRQKFGLEFTLFSQTKMLMILARNPGKCTFENNGLQAWEQNGDKQDCILQGTLKTPEGNFPLIIPMQSIQSEKGKAWQIRSSDNYIAEGSGKPFTPRTRYGWWMERLNQSAYESTAVLLQNAGKPPAIIPWLAAGLKEDQMNEMVSWTEKTGIKPKVEFVLLPHDAWDTAKRTQDDLKFCWDKLHDKRIELPGAFLQAVAERNPLILPVSHGYEIRFPIELRPKDAPFGTAARGRLVWVLDNPEIVSKIEADKANASNDNPTDRMPEDIVSTRFPLKAVRLESSLRIDRPPQRDEGRQ